MSDTLPDNLPLTLTVSEAGKLLRIGRNNMHQLVRSGQIRSIKNGRNILIPRCALIEFLSTAC